MIKMVVVIRMCNVHLRVAYGRLQSNSLEYSSLSQHQIPLGFLCAGERTVVLISSKSNKRREPVLQRIFFQ